MAYKMMTPNQVWAGYNAQAPLNTTKNKEFIEEDILFFSYMFTAHIAEDGEIRASVRVAKANDLKFKKRAILIVQEYRHAVQEEIVKSLAKKGYTVVVPDCTGIDAEFKTEFPPSLSYGNIFQAGEHIKQVSPTAKDTSQYLYSLIAKRTITFINKELGIKDIAIMGIGEATEIAMQTAGTDERLKAIVCINGAGYKEYLHRNKYGNTDEFEIDESLLSWLTGVAAVAYAKHIRIPVMIAISSNSHDVDIDRLPNILALLKNNSVSISITPGSCNSISHYSYQAIIAWLEDILNNNATLNRPQISLKVSEKVIYAEVEADNNRQIEDVNVYYSFGEYDHTVRNWRKVKCQSVGKTQFLTKLEVTQEQGPLFAFCDIIYQEGFNLSSIATYMELDKLDFRPLLSSSSRIVYESSMGLATFTEDSPKEILLQSGIKMQKLHFGLSGIMSSYGELISFDIGRVSKHNKGRILQIDAYSAEDIVFEVKLLAKKDRVIEEYSVSCNLIAKNAFTPFKFSANEFKNDKMLSLIDWDYVKAIKLSNKGVVIGKILFI